jgi:hypothetical protein
MAVVHWHFREVEMVRAGWILLLLLPGITGAQELYRWTDEQGRVHFSDRPRHGDDSVEEVRIRQQPLLGQDEAVQETYNRLQRLRDAERQQQEEQAVQQAEADRLRKQEMAPRCAKAKRELKNLDGPVLYINDKGERYSVPMEQVAADKKRLSEWIATNCKD